MLPKSELNLLLEIKEVPNVTAKMLLAAHKGRTAKPHMYRLLNTLKARQLLKSKRTPTGIRGQPTQIFNLTRKGKKVARLLKELKEALKTEPA